MNDLEYFLTTGDLYVTKWSIMKLIDYKSELTKRLGIDEADDLLNDAIVLELERS